MASLYHSIMFKDDKVRHQFCPSGDTSWCKFRRLGNMENAPHHLEPVFLDILKPLYTNRLAAFELLSRCLPESPRMCWNQSTPFFGRRYPSTNFMEPRKCTQVPAVQSYITTRVQQANSVFSHSCLSLCFIMLWK